MVNALLLVCRSADLCNILNMMNLGMIDIAITIPLAISIAIVRYSKKD
jgi:hypothetical protein